MMIHPETRSWPLALLALATLLPPLGAQDAAATSTPTPTPTPTPTATASPAERFDRSAGCALETMCDKARAMKLAGAAVVAWIPRSPTMEWRSRAQIATSFVKGKANVLALAYSKAAEMADTLADSGGGLRPKLSGEFAYKGGVIRPLDQGYLLAVFSGGAANDDVAIAQEGVARLVQEMLPAVPTAKP